MIAFDPVTGSVLVPDLGMDAVVVHRLRDGSLECEQMVHFPAGSGPRHLAFHPSGSACYVVEELTNVLATLIRTDSGFELTDRVSTLPAGTAGGLASTVRVTANGEHLFVSNRGSDTIATFKVENTLRPTLSAVTSAGGRTPRDMALSIDGLFLFVANQDSDQIMQFAVDASARLRSLRTVAAATPVCVLAPLNVEEGK